MISNDERYAGLQAENELLRQQIAMLEREHAANRERTAQDHVAPYRTLVEISPSAMLLVDLSGRIQFCNQQAAHLFAHVSAADLGGQVFTRLFANNQQFTDIPTWIQQRAAHNGNSTDEYLLCRNDGSRFPAEVNIAVVIDTEGSIAALALTIRDISDRKQAEYALADAYHHLEELNEYLIRSRNLLQAVFDGLEDGLVLLDADGRVAIINRPLATLLGSTPEQLVGQPWATLYPRIAPDFPDHLALEPPSQERNRYRHTRYLNLDGATRFLEVQTIALEDTSQATKQYIVHVVDVTETVQLQARSIQTERFIASGRLAASVAHEINTPLQSLQTALGLARKIPNRTERDAFLVHAQEEIQRVARIVRQLLDLYRPKPVDPGPVDVNNLVERLLLLVGKQLRDQRITVVCELTPDIPPVIGRSDELMQVVLNLLINAIDAMPDGGDLRMQTLVRHDQPLGDSPDVDVVMIVINDSGPGINPTLYKRIFDPFVTTKEGGTGLGLSISQQIVRRHGGTITLDSQMGVGSTFRVLLPLHRMPQEGVSA